ncbi:hypothetical protein HY230_01215 [Candidatus Acetothermia bacterium]|nr:hypothetical protein [Candidatus Acetothermia bacterium]
MAQVRKVHRAKLGPVTYGTGGKVFAVSPADVEKLEEIREKLGFKTLEETVAFALSLLRFAVQSREENGLQLAFVKKDLKFDSLINIPSKTVARACCHVVGSWHRGGVE